MPRYRENLPQLGGDLFLTDAGIETDLIFNRGIEIREFAAHTLLPDPRGRKALQSYFDGFIDLANRFGTGLVLDTVTWKAHRHWANDLGESPAELHDSNRIAVALVCNLRAMARNVKPIVLNAPIGPRGDAYALGHLVTADRAEAYYAEQLGWLAKTEIDMVTGLTFTQSGEAVRLVRAARTAGLPCVISFTVETDGRLPTGQPLREAIEHVDYKTDRTPAYYMINCAHPDHFAEVLRDGDWRKRIRGIRANASRCSHSELDEAEVLDPGNPVELGRQYGDLRAAMSWLNVFGGCCGCDVRHVAAIATDVTAMAA